MPEEMVRDAGRRHLLVFWTRITLEAKHEHCNLSVAIISGAEDTHKPPEVQRDIHNSEIAGGSLDCVKTDTS